MSPFPASQNRAVNGNSRTFARLILARYKGCTNARFILSRSYGHDEFKNANPFLVQKAHKDVQAGQYLRSLNRGVYAANGNSRTFSTNPSSVQRLH